MRAGMSRPRQVLANQFYLITRSCTQRQFLLRPDEETNNAFAYCLAEAAQRTGITIVLPMAESNHHHTIIFDEHGRVPAFTEHFHKMIARCLNARWGRWENFWAAEEVCVTRLLDVETVMDKLVYAATNPVKDFLVDAVAHWPGTNGYLHLIRNKPMRARRPEHFFRARGTMPKIVELELVIPPALGEREAVIAELKRRVADVEKRVREARLQAGKQIIGRRGICEQSWRGSPTSIRPHRRLRPRFAGRPVERIAALIAYKEFLAAYDHARREWLSGRSVYFPTGTYWLVTHTPALVAPVSS
jgi:REP element-mobilizing transposase RayT